MYTAKIIFFSFSPIVSCMKLQSSSTTLFIHDISPWETVVKKKSLIVNSHWKQKKKNKNPKVKTKQIEKKSHPTQREAIAPETLPRKKFHFASSTSTRSPFSSCTPPATTTTNKKKIEKQSFFFTGYAVSKLNKKGNSQLLKK